VRPYLSLATRQSLPPPTAAAANRKFVFKIKKNGNIVIEAKDAEAAKHKLRERYPDCEILEMEER